MNAIPHYAVIFRTHFWDEFAQRQFDRIKRQVGNGHIYVLVDETKGPVKGIHHDRIVRITEQDVIEMGFLRAGSGNMFWYNGDYPLYYFYSYVESYDYYLQIEYDVVLNENTDDLVAKAASDKVDFIGLTKGEPVDQWFWLDTMKDFYSMSDVDYKLICLSLFSNASLQALSVQRLLMANQWKNFDNHSWPFCEGFIATEMRRHGFRVKELSDFVDTKAYDSWPPYVEKDLSAMANFSVIHPVLDEERYIASLLKYKVGIGGYLNINSLFHRKLRRLSISSYIKTLVRSFTQKATRDLYAGRYFPKKYNI